MATIKANAAKKQIVMKKAVKVLEQIDKGGVATKAIEKEVQKAVPKGTHKETVKTIAKIIKKTNDEVLKEIFNKKVLAKNLTAAKPNGLVRPDTNPARPTAVTVKGRQTIVSPKGKGTAKKVVQAPIKKLKVPSIAETAAMFEKNSGIGKTPSHTPEIHDVPSMTLIRTMNPQHEAVSMANAEKNRFPSPATPPSITKPAFEVNNDKISLASVAAGLRNMQNSVPSNFPSFKTRG